MRLGNFLAHPSGEQLFVLLDRMVRAMGSVPQSQTTMSAMLIMLATSAVFLFDMYARLLFAVCCCWQYLAQLPIAWVPGLLVAA